MSLLPRPRSGAGRRARRRLARMRFGGSGSRLGSLEKVRMLGRVLFPARVGDA